MKNPAGQGRIRASVLSGERLDDRLGDRVGVLVKHEVAAVEIAQLGGRHNLLHEFRGSGQDERVISPPDDERLRLPVLQIGGPFRVVLDVRRQVHKQPRHEDPIRRDRESIGVDRPIVRIQGVGLARAPLVKKFVAVHGGKLLGFGQILWGFRAAEPLVDFQAVGVPTLH